MLPLRRPIIGVTKIIELKKIRVGVVNYLNTKPLLFGLSRPPISKEIVLIEDYPANLADRLIAGDIDIGLVPVAVIPKLSTYHIIGDYCIGAQGEIASVALFSEVPMTEIKRVYLDYQSRTSVALLKYLMKESWGINPELIDAKDENYRKEIKGTTAGLVIGDRAFEQRKVSTFIYDLGSEWRSITSLPFVFAVWITLQPLPYDFIEEFNKANGLGLSHIDDIIRENPYQLFDLGKYYNFHLSYHLDDRKRRGLERFLNAIAEI